MLGNPTSANQAETDNAMWQTNTHRTSNDQTCSYISNTDHNTEGGWLWNHPTVSGAPSGMDLVEVGGNRSQSGTPDGMSHSERAPSSNNLTSAGNILGMNLSNGLPMLGNTLSKKTRIGRGGIRIPALETLPIIASNYRVQTQDEQKHIVRDLSAYYSDNICPDYHSCVQIYESLGERHKKKNTAILTAVATLTKFEEQNQPAYNDNIINLPPKKLVFFCDTLPRYLPLTIGFDMAGQR